MITASFMAAAYLMLPVDATAYLLYDGGLRNIAMVLATMLVALYFNDLYSGIFVKSRILLVQQLCMSLGSVFLIQGLASYLHIGFRVPLHVMGPGSAIALVGMYFWRIFFSTYAIRVMGRDRLLLVGDSPLLELIAEHCASHPERGLQVIGYLDDRPESAASRSVKFFGDLHQLRSIVTATNPSRIVVGVFPSGAIACRWPICSSCGLRAI